MWSYYGSKENIAHRYPTPKHAKLIEPFAGSARYAMRYFDRDVLLVDKNETVVGIWKWLQQCSIKDIQGLPRDFKPGQRIDDIDFGCQEARNLMGFLVGYGMAAPRRNVSAAKMNDRPNFIKFRLNTIAKNLFKIQHWNIELGDYADIENQTATWFIDPPYQFGGHYYPNSNKKIDFRALSDWCVSRSGQVIVCENSKATWMDFVPMAQQQGSKGMQKEVIWTNEKTHFDNLQMRLEI